MLIDFITANRAELIASTRLKVAKRMAPTPTERELLRGVPLFFDQLVQTLRKSLPPNAREIERTAAEHGAALLNRGYTIGQVVHDYGDICQAITELAVAQDAPLSTLEFHTLNHCLDNAIAQAVMEFTRLRDLSFANGEVERSGMFAHELRNKIAAAQMGFQTIRSGRAPVGGSVAALVSRSLHGMSALIDRALVEVRVDSGQTQRQRMGLQEIMTNAEADGTLEANDRGVHLTVAPFDRDVDVEADPQVLAGVIANLLQNACKFTKPGGRVSLTARLVGERVELEIQDECGGLPAATRDSLFGAFQQHSANREGLGLGLFISRKGTEASGGKLRVRDLPGSGCVFTIDLPVLPPLPAGAPPV